MAPSVLKVKPKRLLGITRELQSLLGDNAPALALAQPVKPKFAERIKRAGPSAQWQWTSFTNPSRRPTGTPLAEVRDGTSSLSKGDLAKAKLRLSHWVRDLPKDYVEGSDDSKFARFNTTSAPYSYSTEEFHQLLREDDWSKDETDHLFALAHQYDLRFIVMADRWDFASERSVDVRAVCHETLSRAMILNPTLG